jgi:hypothetical protein
MENSMAVNQFQRKHLQQRIRDARYLRVQSEYEAFEAAHTPAGVKRAKAQIEKLEAFVRGWDRRASEQSKKIRLRVEAEATKCQELILFAEPEAALKAVEKFERGGK